MQHRYRSEEETSEIRTPTYSLSEEDRQKSYAEEDQRWSRGMQLRDWIVLVAVLTIVFSFVLIDAYLEPGLGGLAH